MADDPQNDSPRSDRVDVKEDADTAAARKELRHTVISEERKATAGSEAGDTGRTTPDAPQDPDTIDQVASPKKKRAREDDVVIDIEDLDAQSIASTDSAKDRASRLEPEKKRHRDAAETEASAAAAKSDKATESTDPAPAPKEGDDAVNPALDTTHRPAEEKQKPVATAPSAFASSGFAKLSNSSASPFGAAAGGKPSVFGGSASAASPFASASPQKPAPAPAATPTLSFGGQAGASPFASAKSGSNGFGSAFGGFGSASSNKPLSSFAKAGSSFKSEKPVKPFGAPESEAEESEGDEDDEDGGSDREDKEAKDDADKDDTKAAEDKKKKLQKVALDDGEAGETTVLAVRAKLYFLEKDFGWRERGSGMLKINVPESCVSFEDGIPVPGSFDASELDGDDSAEGDEAKRKVVRLIMRQDSTHRMLLNTVVLPALQFQEKTTLKAVGILFTAFEGDGQAVSVQAKMSAQSARNFMNEIGLVQRELSGN